MIDQKHTPGKWVWSSFDDGKTYGLFTPDRGRLVVMDFVRSGMRDGAPRFSVGRNGPRVGGRMTHLPFGEVGKHPDAALIAAAPDMALLLQAIRTGVCAFYEPTGEIRFDGLMVSTRDDDWSSTLDVIGRERVQGAVHAKIGGVA